jgi:enoyl-CoA hydratase/carnithine racemase
VVEDEALMESARALAQQLVRQPPAALAATRRLLRGDPAALLERIEAEARIFSAQLKSEEFRAAVSAFLARAKGK